MYMCYIHLDTQTFGLINALIMWALLLPIMMVSKFSAHYFTRNAKCAYTFAFNTTSHRVHKR